MLSYQQIFQLTPSQQMEDSIKILDTMFPEGIAVFIFDCSSAPKAFAKGALMVHKMNKSPGGMQPKMHNTIISATWQL